MLTSIFTPALTSVRRVESLEQALNTLAETGNLPSDSFFKLHDLDRDGILNRNELEAIYGLHHETSREKSADDAEHKRKTDEILAKVMSTLDKNGDGIITKTEFVSAGREGLPEFANTEGLGHHYDSEGEYFLVNRIEVWALEETHTE